jgi:hypothetical protein
MEPVAKHNVVGSGLRDDGEPGGSVPFGLLFHLACCSIWPGTDDSRWKGQVETL